MKISTALTFISSIGFDSSAFIYFIMKNPTYLAQMDAIFDYVHSGSLSIVASTITLTEVLMTPLRNQNVQVEREYREILLSSAYVTIAPVSIVVAERAAYLRAVYNLRTPDALHLATAIVAGCEAFLTNDKGLKRVTELRILILDELELDPPPPEQP